MEKGEKVRSVLVFRTLPRPSAFRSVRLITSLPPRLENVYQEWAIGVCKKALLYEKDQTGMSKAIKDSLDKKYGPTWHCIVGSEFRAYTSFESKTFLYVPVGAIGKRAVLLYKCDPA